MSSFQLNSNEELYGYLVSLADTLRQKGRDDLADQVSLASQFAFGSASEFLHEGLIALMSIQPKCRGILSEDQQQGLESVVQQIKSAFEKIGGA